MNEGAQTVSPNGVAHIAAEEGIVPAPYYDSEGVLTYGIGHTAAAGHPDPKTLPRGMPANLDDVLFEILRLFNADLKHYTADVLREVQVPLAQHELDALVDFHFNTGGISHASIVRHLNAGDRKRAAESFDLWHKPPTIIGRRDRQRKLFEHGIYSGRNVSVWKVSPKGHVTFKPVMVYKPDQIAMLLSKLNQA